ncbi:MAG: DUF5686 and carboxypeptidase regulatory-like domain-containing protein [Prevotella sp.]|nr:DUF5686 and carboxypeptidase regulatory-like domain-containing protein [Prevotella sp.]
MKKSIKIKAFIIILLCALATAANAQIKGFVVDAATGDSIAFASVAYKDLRIAKSSNVSGVFTIEKKTGHYLTISAIGYKSQRILIQEKTPAELHVCLTPDSKMLGNVVVKAKRKKYKRKDNPAVELMKRVIAAKKRTDLDNHDYYQYTKYQKLTLAENEVNASKLEEKKSKQWIIDQIETNPWTNKLILPLSVDETVTQKLYRRNPKTTRDIIMGKNSTGVNQLIETGDILNTALKDCFTDVDIYDDQVRLLQYPFTSPIGKDAVAFYRYYIVDTVYIDRDQCYHLQFLPNNQQDFGFRGEIWVLTDSTLHVKKCNLTIPKRSDVNFVDNLQIQQEYTKLPGGEWVLTRDDMMVEMKLAKFLSKFVVMRTTRNSDYVFDPLPNKLFKGKAKERHEADAMMKDEVFWDKYRAVNLTKGESSMDKFIHNLEQIKGFKFIMFGAKAFIENFVETGTEKHPSKVDIGPINTMISKNFIDGLRTRVSAQTTANLSKHWFLEGYYAHGWNTHKNYYRGAVTYSFNKKNYLPREFPKRTLTLESTYDIEYPSDKYIKTDKDNVFTAFKWTDSKNMQFYNRQKFSFDWEEVWGLRIQAALKTEENQSAGTMAFRPLATLEDSKFRTTEASVDLTFSPGRTYINTKQRRLPINLDAPIFSISHTMGFKDFLGGDYKSNFTEASIYKRFWMKSWGKIDVYLKGGAQWNKVPFPLLIMPAANMSYILEDETFNLLNNMEFLNDRYASLDLSWDLNGKIFNRIPLLKKLKWREFLGVKCLWGKLTDKNNPALHPGDPVLMEFPDGSYVMNPHRPYVEVLVGIHNIFKILHVEYVRRLNYLDLPTANKQGIRFMFRITF